ncbi:hypothetical protein JYK14_24480 [Siccirubricoccus sp. KC 17139]|uniref:Uncharacterized protein n=1 Tax=Siccirubricoccus soli TaxID=2899147 RepID=A0ABT1DBH5_9PROT|nr:hypothetical protein [Siccirubricoccus soli]MCO6419292.1 hypothetical protein [Siccirubricoccus soli]MCP2685427.1 hypothetical protein [Siccirubricoccus soli]
MRFLQSVVAAIRASLQTVLEAVTTWTRRGGKWVIETKLVQKTLPDAQAAADWAGDLAGRAIAATPGAAWTATKLTAGGGWAATKFVGRNARDHGPGAVKAAMRGTGKMLKTTGKVVAAPVVLPVKGAVAVTTAAAGAVGEVGAALLSPLGRVLGGGGGSVPTPPPPPAPPAEAPKAEVGQGDSDGLTAAERDRREVAIAVRRAVRAKGRGEDPSEFLEGLRDQVDDERLSSLEVWVDQLRADELKTVSQTSLNRLEAHLEGKRKLTGVPSVEEAVEAAIATERSRPFATKLNKVRAATMERTNGLGAGMPPRRATRDLLNDEYAAS